MKSQAEIRGDEGTRLVRRVGLFDATMLVVANTIYRTRGTP